MPLFNDFKRFWGSIGSHFVTFPSPGPQKWSKDVPKSEKNVKKKNPGKGLEKGPCQEGAKPLKVMIVTHFHLFFKRPWASKKEPKWELK